MKKWKWKDCHHEEHACIEGDSIYIQCQKPEEWEIFQKSGQHRGHFCKAKKDAKARVLKKYTNVR